VELGELQSARRKTMSDLKGKVAVVTGASKGIGAATAKALAAAGAAVVVNYVSDQKGADNVVAAITAKGGKAVAVKADVAKPADVRRLFEEAKKAFGRIDILVNNAGIYQFQPLDEITEDDFHRDIDHAAAVRAEMLRGFLGREQGAEHIGVEETSSVASETATPTASVYSASKGAVDTLSRVLAAELGPRKIRVNVIAPGGVETEGTHTAGVIGSDFEKSMISKTALGRLGQPDDIARVAVFLASDDSGWLTGERVVASGGYF
jgi:3-oxoacyl-[acyl-carrier protein] reductase